MDDIAAFAFKAMPGTLPPSSVHDCAQMNWAIKKRVIKSNIFFMKMDQSCFAILLKIAIEIKMCHKFSLINAGTVIENIPLPTLVKDKSC